MFSSSDPFDLFGVPYYINSTTRLDLYFKKLIKLPAEIGNLINLYNLNLTNNQLTSLPAEIGNLINLEILYLTNNQLTSLPAEIGNLINLEILYLSNNQLTSLPAEIGKLIKLQQLYLNNNKLTSLPVELLNIKNNISIDDTSYDINNLDIDCKILLFTSFNRPLKNLPSSLTHIWFKKPISVVNIKLPFGCEIVYF
jgi:Leucine-rich repeat (LRR) protein